MTRIFLTFGLLMAMLCLGKAQIVRITDSENHQPLQTVSISGENIQSEVLTDHQGKADISSLAQDSVIWIRMIGYKSLQSNLKQLKKWHFEVSLQKSVEQLKEVIVSSYQKEIRRFSSLHIEPIKIQKINETGALNLSNALTQIPGVSQLSTGPAISKPSIRGLYGNRVLVLFSGLRFDNQQWQDEHGMGLSNMGISRVEVIKGPLSILYGTEAIGGIINIIQEEPCECRNFQTDIQTWFHSNTLGGNLQWNYQVNKGKKWYALQLNAIAHSDYSDGNNNRVLNSRFKGYQLQTSMGFRKNKWRSDNHYYFSFDQFGFIFNDLNHFMQTDNRWAKKMNGPHHIVMLNLLSSNNLIQLPHSMLQINLGLQSNLRQEDEGNGELSLRMHLFTGQYAIKWNKQLSDQWYMVVSNNSSLENNTNFGFRKLVPDAWTAETSFSGYLKYQSDYFILEYGLGGGLRYINALPTDGVNSAEKDIAPFQQTRPFINVMLGSSIIPDDQWTLKFNVASGVRAPNLAELSVNGLHEGTYSYEIGNPDLKNEQNINGDLSLYFNSNYFHFSASGFYNYFKTYIYLQPTEEEWNSFPVYRFIQDEASIYGGEASTSVYPFSKSADWEIFASYSGLVGQLIGGDYLPYMPAQEIKPGIRFEHKFNPAFSVYATANTEFVLEQNLTNSMETSTPAYHLVNASAGLSLKRKSLQYTLNIAGNNLLNEAYYDHLSRLKYYNILNMGRDISVHLKIQFINNKNSKK